MFKILMIIGLLWCAYELDLGSDCDGHYCGITTDLIANKGK
ncbi:hypothetical protein [Avibacterium paragallinarum]|uniref:Uncharacterized protein n=1 Tax=Avibacterium paragallinarum TaxID=728 RepID=A0A377I829_AVIPA|nr:hypothetical protein [Avibacterium paragallinarum]STO71343.1 Uncharacterised protein [Avibacterium paragallinarum]STO71829.1 Uncharacterised protein [Avibacterium paragallinarum]STO73003.1 Uncharacterised protein [Avibacterium paragallinarum]SUU96926.1 Uncharacterised protein [Avibacterium paragallinarum]SUU97116.1 Uncharacterised protein [Avibacterium paragallinarum]